MSYLPLDVWQSADSLNRAFVQMQEDFNRIAGKVEKAEPLSVSDALVIAQWLGIAQGVVSERAQALRNSPQPPPLNHRAQVHDFYRRQTSDHVGFEPVDYGPIADAGALDKHRRQRALDTLGSKLEADRVQTAERLGLDDEKAHLRRKGDVEAASHPEAVGCSDCGGIHLVGVPHDFGRRES